MTCIASRSWSYFWGKTKGEGEKREREGGKRREIYSRGPARKSDGCPTKRPPHCRSGAPHNAFPRVTTYFSSQPAQTLYRLLLLTVLLAPIGAHVDQGRCCMLTGCWALCVHIIDTLPAQGKQKSGPQGRKMGKKGWFSCCWQGLPMRTTTSHESKGIKVQKEAP